MTLREQHAEALAVSEQCDARYERIASAILADDGPHWISARIRRGGVVLAVVLVVDAPYSLPADAETREGRAVFCWNERGELVAQWTPKRGRTARPALVTRDDGTAIRRVTVGAE